MHELIDPIRVAYRHGEHAALLQIAPQLYRFVGTRADAAAIFVDLAPLEHLVESTWDFFVVPDGDEAYVGAVLRRPPETL